MLLDKHASITGEYTVLLNTYHGENGEIEQNTIDWWTKVKEIANKWWTKIQIDPKQVEVITFSGQMEDVIPISEKHPNQRAILYLDTRADQEATIINEKLPTIHKKQETLFVLLHRLPNCFGLKIIILHCMKQPNAMCLAQRIP